MDGRSKGPLGHLVCHCLIVETDQGLVLVDTGYGLKDVRRPHPRLPHAFKTLLNIRLREEETAIRQVEALGYRASDVRHIVLTHLDFDHAGGIEDFPHARVHVMQAELQAVRNERRGFIAKQRYRPLQFNDAVDWALYEPGAGERWLGFDAVRNLDGLPPEILMIPLPGHTRGHAGVAIKTSAGWLLHAGDAYFFRGEVRQPKRECPPGLRLYQNMMEVNRAQRLENQRRLRQLSLECRSSLRIVCAHDAVEFERCVADSAGETQLHGKLNRLEAAPMYGARP